MVMSTIYILSTSIKDREIIASPKSKEPIDYEGRQTKVKIWM